MNDADSNDQGAPGDELERSKSELLALLLAEQAQTDEPIVPRAPGAADAPLSPAQERIWFLEQLDPGSPLYNFHGVLRLRGHLDQRALEEALRGLIARHAVLRTNIVTRNGMPLAIVRDSSAAAITVENLGDLAPVEREAAASRALHEESQHPFDLSRDDLLRLRLLKLAADEHLLLVTVHHVACDGWSSGILFRELTQLYGAACGGRPADLPQLPIQYADFAAWQRRMVAGNRLDGSLEYWVRKLAGPLPILELPLDRPRPSIQRFQGAAVAFAFSAALTAKLYQSARALGTTVFVVMLAAYRALLHRRSGQTDILIGCPFADRPRVETEGLIGAFVNNVVMRTAVAGDLSFRALVGRERTTYLEASEHRAVPFERLVERLNPERDRSRSPIFQTMLAFLNAPPAEVRLEGLQISAETGHSGTSEFDLSLYVTPPANPRTDPSAALSGYFEFCTTLFDAETVEATSRQFQRLLAAAVARPDTAIADLPLLSDTEIDRIVFEWNATGRELPAAATIPVLIEAQVRRAPGATALICGDGALTYAELNVRANRLAHRLIAAGVGAGVLVGVMTDRGTHMVVALLAVLKAGGAYLPVDPTYPAERIAQMVEDSGTPLILTQSEYAHALPRSGAEVIVLDREPAGAGSTDDADPGVAISPRDLAYTIYTSGSTGRPKGVQIEHRSVVNLLLSVLSEPGIGPSDALLAVTTISFDIHVLEIFGPLAAGGTLVVASRASAADGQRLYETLVSERITVMQATPATWRLLLAVWPEREGYRLNRILCGGEALTRALADALLAHADQVWNLYGPTETTVWSATGLVAAGAGPPSIGRPLANTRIYILDEFRKPVPAGVLGELYIGGAGVSRGYLGRPELTAERFVPDPFASDLDRRMYRTGDLARFRRDGNIDIGMRTDTQVKIRGYRVELGEIDAVLARHPAVAQAVSAVKEERPGDQRLVAFLVARGPERPGVAALRAHAQTYLPEYMVPSVHLWLESIPLTPNGKVDRNALVVPRTESTTPDARFAAPQTPVETVLAAVFAEVLRVERVGRFDNFFDLGGHSLLTIQVVDRFERETGVRMQPGELFQQTVGQIAASHEAQIAATASAPVRRNLAGRLKSALGGLFRPGRAS